jgi:hypothetical protein
MGLPYRDDKNVASAKMMDQGASSFGLPGDAVARAFERYANLYRFVRFLGINPGWRMVAGDFEPPRMGICHRPFAHGRLAYQLTLVRSFANGASYSLPDSKVQWVDRFRKPSPAQACCQCSTSMRKRPGYGAPRRLGSRRLGDVRGFFGDHDDRPRVLPVTNIGMIDASILQTTVLWHRSTESFR